MSYRIDLEGEKLVVRFRPSPWQWVVYGLCPLIAAPFWAIAPFMAVQSGASPVLLVFPGGWAALSLLAALFLSTRESLAVNDSSAVRTLSILGVQVLQQNVPRSPGAVFFATDPPGFLSLSATDNSIRLGDSSLRSGRRWLSRPQAVALADQLNSLSSGGDQHLAL